MNTRLDAIVSYNSLCWRMSLVIYRGLLFRCGVRKFPSNQPQEKLL